MAKSLRPHEVAPVPTVPFPEIAQEAQTEAVLLSQAQTVKPFDMGAGCEDDKKTG